MEGVRPVGEHDGPDEFAVRSSQWSGLTTTLTVRSRIPASTTEAGLGLSALLRTAEAVRSHGLLTRLVFTLVNAFQSRQGLVLIRFDGHLTRPGC